MLLSATVALPASSGQPLSSSSSSTVRCCPLPQRCTLCIAARKSSLRRKRAAKPRLGTVVPTTAPPLSACLGSSKRSSPVALLNLGTTVSLPQGLHTDWYSSTNFFCHLLRSLHPTSLYALSFFCTNRILYLGHYRFHQPVSTAPHSTASHTARRRASTFIVVPPLEPIYRRAKDTLVWYHEASPPVNLVINTQRIYAPLPRLIPQLATTGS